MQTKQIYLDVIDSTNNELKRRLSTAPPEEYTVICAGYQTAGRGRSGHGWTSAPGASLAGSMVIYPKGLAEEEIPQLTILAAVAVSRALEDMFGLSPSIKWVNDVLLGGKKVCGILCERIIQPEAVIIGIGVNMRPGSYPEELSNMAACVEEYTDISGEEIFREVRERIWTNCIEYCDIWRNGGKSAPILQEYNSRLINRGRQVKVLDPSGEYEALATGADEKGRLIVRLPDGKEKRIDSGEVSVRGVLGYGI